MNVFLLWIATRDELLITFLIHNQCVFTLFPSSGNPYIGPDAVLNGVFARIGAEHEYFNVKDIELHDMSGNQVLATLRYDAKRKGSGKLIDAQAAHLWTLKDGKVVAFQQYVDTKQLAEAAR